MGSKAARTLVGALATGLFLCSYVFFAVDYFVPKQDIDPEPTMVPAPPSPTDLYLSRFRPEESPGSHVAHDTIRTDKGVVSFALPGAFRTGVKPGTESMIPTINNHSKIIYAPPTMENVRIGDIITFRPNATSNRTIIHRVINITTDGSYVTRGDNNRYTDPEPVNFSQITGVVAAIIY